MIIFWKKYLSIENRYPLPVYGFYGTLVYTPGFMTKFSLKKWIKELLPLCKSSLRVNNSSSISHHKNKTNVTGYLIIEWFSFSRPFSKVQLNKQLCKKQRVGCQTWDNNSRGLAYQEASNTAHEVITTFSHKRWPYKVYSTLLVK